MPPFSAKAPPNTSEVIAINLMRMLLEGPEVSLSGSPTVSPTTAALWVSVPFVTPGIYPDSMYFLALSQAPPALEKATATCTPETMAPERRPQTPLGPRRKPTTRGERRTKRPGATMCLMEACVAIVIHAV